MDFILGKWVKYCTKEGFRTLRIVLIGCSIITLAAVIKYKPVYEVTLAGKTIGYVADKEKTENKIEKYINSKENNIAFRIAGIMPEYNKVLVARTEETNEAEVIALVESDVQTTYQTYAITVDGEKKADVSSEEEAMQIVEEVKKDLNKEVEMTLGVVSIYSNTLEINSKEEAIASLNEIKTQKVNAYETKKAEEAKAKAAAAAKARSFAYTSTSTLASTGEVLGMAISVPVNGSISSRFGERSSSRSSAHTGLDISAPMGTGIRPIAAGTVTFAAYNGSYGNLVKIDHGNGVESWYAHCSAIYVSVGQTVDTGTTISAVGSTGNSTGPHLHLEIRINGSPMNPQNYLYR